MNNYVLILRPCPQMSREKAPPRLLSEAAASIPGPQDFRFGKTYPARRSLVDYFAARKHGPARRGIISPAQASP